MGNSWDSRVTNQASQQMSVTWVRLMVQTFEGAGLNSQALFNQLGLEHSRLTDSNATFSQDELSGLWQLASQQSGNPAIGLLMASSPVISVFNELSFGILASETMQHALQRLIRYQRLIGEAMDFSLVDEDGGHRFIINSHNHKNTLAYEGFDAALAIILANVRWVSQIEFTPIEITLFHPQPKNTQPYDQLFCCPVKYNTPVTSVLIAHADFVRPSPMGNKGISDKHDLELNQSITELEKGGLSEQVLRHLKKHWQGQEPRIEDLARQFNMSKRTFQRHLKEQGHTFLNLVDQTRQALALEYIQQKSLTLQQVSHALAFSEHGNFYRAFKRWYGLTPKQYRDELTNKQHL